MGDAVGKAVVGRSWQFYPLFDGAGCCVVNLSELEDFKQEGYIIRYFF